MEMINNCMGTGAYYNATLSLSDGSSYDIIGNRMAILFTEIFDW